MYLFILNGSKEGTRIDLATGTYIIGRSPDADILLTDDKFISGFHADISFSKSGVISIVDHNSRNGTFLLGDPVTKQMKINPGDIFRIGHTFLKLSRRDQERYGSSDESLETAPEAIVVIDLVGSSNIAQAMGDRVASKVKNTLLFYLNENLKKYPAEYVKNTGDGFLLIISKIKPAINLARKFLADLKGQKSFGGIRVRIGIHFGETSKLPDGDRRGMAVDMAFRVESVKIDDMHQTLLGIKKDMMPRSDRIFITEVVQNMIANDSSLKTRCIGFFDLKGFTGRHKIFEVII